MQRSNGSGTALLVRVIMLLNKRSILALLAVVSLVLPAAASAQTYFSRVATGNWNANATWSTASCGGAAAASFPTDVNNHDVQICNGNDITIPTGVAVSARSVTINQQNGTGQLIHAAATSAITVGVGGVTINGAANNNINSWNINAGSAVVNGPVTLVEGGNNNRVARILLTTGSLDINGNLTMTNAGGAQRTVIDMSGGAGNLFLSGDFTLSSGLGTVTPGTTSTFTYDTATAAVVATGSSIQYRNLVVNKAGGTATTTSTPATRTMTVLGTLNVQAGTLDITGVNVVVTGATTVAGTMTLSSATVTTKTFTGDVTITGSWNNSGNTPVTMGGSLTNNGTFTSGSGAYTFATTAGQQWAGSSGLVFNGNVVVNATRTNNTTTTIVGDITGTSTLTNGTGQTLNIAGDTIGLNALVATASNNTVNYNGTVARTAKTSSYFHLTISATDIVTLEGNTSIAGNLYTNGNFDPIAGNFTVSFNGTGAQGMLGTATGLTFYRLTINNTAALTNRKVTINYDVTVNDILTFTSGRIVTAGTTKVIVPSSGTVSGAAGSPDNRYVAGRLQKFVSNGNPVITFEIGTDGASEPSIGYSPIDLAFQNVAGTGGNLMAYATLNDHPNIGTSTLDDTKSVNRYWTLTTTGVSGTGLGAGTFTGFDATFGFVNVSPSTDVDAGANTALLEAERWDGSTWNVTTAATRTSTSTQATGITAIGEFAVAEKKAGGSPAGGFNAMDAPTCAVSGVIKTKVAGIPTSLNVVALNATKTGLQTNFNSLVRVELMNAANNTGYPDANGCGPNWTVIQQLADVDFDNTDMGCKATASFTVSNVYRDVRVRITEDPGKPSEKIACSGDNFTVRPDSLAVTAHDATWETAGTTRALSNTASPGGNVHKASTVAATTPRPFTLRVTPFPATATNYDGSPTIAVGFPSCGMLCSTPGTLDITAGSWASAGGGVRENPTANYSEAGTFNLQLQDTTFAAVDNFDGTPDTCSNVSPFGRRACSSTVEVGRFVPDRFQFASPSTPVLLTHGSVSCGPRSFTYIGQNFWFGTFPSATLNAVNAAGGVTVNYPLDTNTSRPVLAETYADSSAPAGAPLNTASVGVPPNISGAGTATYGNFATGTLSYARNNATEVAPFNAAISLTVTATDSTEAAVSGNGNITTPSALVFNGGGSGIAFDGGDFSAGLTNGKTLVYGRLSIRNSNGSPLVPLPVRMETQYWNGTSFLTNAADNCTLVDSTNIGLGNYTGNLNSGETTVTVPAGRFVSGRKTLTLSAPGAANSGSVDLVLNLGSGAIDMCPTWGPAAPTAASLAYLRGKWCAAITNTYTKDPTARARFGAFPGADEVIFIREN